MTRDLNKENENNEQYHKGYKDGRNESITDSFMRSWDPLIDTDSPYSKGREQGLRDQNEYGRLDRRIEKNRENKKDSKSSYSNTSSRTYSSEESDSDDDDDDSDETETKPKVKRIDVIIDIFKRMSKEKKKEIKEELRNMSKEYLELNCLYGRVYYEGIPRVSESRRDEIKDKLRSMSREDLELNYLRGVSIPLLARGVLLEARPNMKDRDGKSRQNRSKRQVEMFSKRLDSMSKEEIEEIKKKIDSDSMSKEELRMLSDALDRRVEKSRENKENRRYDEIRGKLDRMSKKELEAALYEREYYEDRGEKRDALCMRITMNRENNLYTLQILTKTDDPKLSYEARRRLEERFIESPELEKFRPFLNGMNTAFLDQGARGDPNYKKLEKEYEIYIEREIRHKKEDESFKHPPTFFEFLKSTFFG